jgi:HK97 family phage prohead protease
MSEKRAATLGAETRENGDLVLRGYAALYDTETVIAGMFRESIAPGAFAAAVGRDDVRALFNHDPNVVLGRSVAGTLRLEADEQGLRYEVSLNPADSEHQRVWQMVARGDVSQSSFGFEVTGQEWAERKKSDVLPLRIIRDVRLFDVSPVTFAAYAETTVTVRDLPGAREAAAAEVQAAKSAADVVPVVLRQLELDARR